MVYSLSMRKKAQIDKQMFFDFYGVSLLSDQYLETNPYAKEYKDMIVQQTKDVYVPLITKMCYSELWQHTDKVFDWEKWKEKFNLGFVTLQKVKDLSLEQLAQVYNEGEWERVYGGEAWGSIVESLIQLKDTTDTNQLITIIDHINDIQHNTGLMFHDFPKVEKWFYNALEIKTNATPQQLLPYLSSDIKNFVVDDLKLKGEEIITTEPVKYLTLREKMNLAESIHTPPETLAELARDNNKDVRRLVALNDSTLPETLVELAKDKDKGVLYDVSFNLNTPEEIKEEIKRKLEAVLNMRKKAYIVYDDKGRKFEVI